MNTIQGRALVQCNSNEGRFTYEPNFSTPQTIESVQSAIDSNGGKVTGYRYTGVKVLRIQSRNWVAGEKIIK